MKRKIIIWSIVAVLALLILFFVVWVNEFIPKYNWTENYSYKSEEPYGTKLMYDLLNESVYEDNFTTIKEKITSEFYVGKKRSSYIFIGSSFIIDSVEMEYLLDYAYIGNNLMLSSNEISSSVMNRIFKNCPVEFQYNSHSQKNVSFTSNNEANNFYFQKIEDTVFYRWAYIDTIVDYNFYNPYTNCLDTLGKYNSGELCFVKVKHGSGNIYIHTMPLSFTNFHVLYNNNLAYLNNIFSFINEDSKVYWDSYHNAPSGNFGDQINVGKTPLKFILKQKELRWAWYIAIILCTLFMIFKSKRKQAIIPVLPKNINTSIEFAKALSTLYFQSKDHVKIGEEMFKLFKLFIRNRYYLNTQMNEEELKESIARKSGIELKYIEAIYSTSIKLRYSPHANNEALVKHYNTLQYFYKNCK